MESSFRFKSWEIWLELKSWVFVFEFRKGTVAWTEGEFTISGAEKSGNCRSVGRGSSSSLWQLPSDVSGVDGMGGLWQQTFSSTWLNWDLL